MILQSSNSSSNSFVVMAGRLNEDQMKREYFLKTCLVKDLRVECRNRGISPAGSRDTLVERLTTAMATKGETDAVQPSTPKDLGNSVNNYTRPEGQNVGNFLTDRSSSRVLAPPGGKSSVLFFGETAPSAVVEDRTRRSMSPPVVPPPTRPTQTTKEAQLPPTPGKQTQSQTAEPQTELPNTGLPGLGQDRSANNYSRPGDRQNVGNYITGRNTSRVLAPPGGGSSFTFG